MELAAVAALLTGIIWGVTPSLYAEASREGGSIRANFWKSLGAFFILSIISIVRGDLSLPPPMGLLFIITNASLGTGIADFLFLKALALIGPGRATPIGFTYLIWSALLPSIMIGEIFSPKTLLGAAIALAGIWLSSRGGGEWKIKGIVFSLSASIGWTLSPIAAKLALNYVSEVTLATWNSLLVTLTYGLLSAPAYRVRGSGRAALGGTLGSGLALVLYFYAVRELGVAIASLATALAPVVSLVISRFSEGGTDRASALGSIVTIAGIVIALL